MSLAAHEVYQAQVQALRAELARVTAERDAAITALGLIAKFPWQALPDYGDADDGEWAIVNDRGETIARISQTRDGKTPGAWARWLCKIVNALPRLKS